MTPILPRVHRITSRGLPATLTTLCPDPQVMPFGHEPHPST